jgi:biopolymer transport protein ExbB
VFELVKSGGWMMWPIILCSIAAAAIIGERLWSLQKKYIAPPGLMDTIRGWLERQELDATRIAALRQSSPLGRVLAAGLSNRTREREIIKEAIEDAGRHTAPELERYLNTLGTIAAISPFLGLMGTVIGMIQMFSGLGAGGMGDPSLIASGIAQALMTTAAGLGVAIPAVIFYRYFRGRINELIVDMEQEAVRLVEILQGRRERVE